MELLEQIQKRLLNESAKYYQNYIPQNKRDYQCAIDNCNNPAIAKGYCNAHYIRSRNGKDLSKPIKNRRRGTLCNTCNKPLSGKGGWNLCMNHYKQARRRGIWEVVIEYFGGKCKLCGGSYPVSCYDLHHKNRSEKEKGIGTLIDAVSIERLVEEILKCELYCANCHRIIHHG